jgi:hypothetical protein
LAAPRDDRSDVDDRWRRLRGPGRQHRTISLRTPLRRDDVEDDGVSEPPRPVVRGECVNGPRPCPYVACRHHLFLEVRRSGGLTLAWPTLDPWDLPETCSLDLADGGGMTLEQVGLRLNLTRERTRQTEEAALSKLREAPELRVRQRRARRLPTDEELDALLG